MTNSIRLGERLRQYRKNKMLTLQQLSEQSGISTGYISKIERGTVNPSLKNIQRLCFALDINPQALMSEEAEIPATDTTKEAVSGITEDKLEDKEKTNKNRNQIIRAEESTPIYGIADILDFKRVYEDGEDGMKVSVMKLAGHMHKAYYSSHPYREFGIVVKGKMEIELNDKEKYELNEGDCIMIGADTKHSVGNLFDEECVSYWIQLADER